jgi:D-glycero-D-manno-heptose 1,7-bisphosphate phosphatase
VGRLSRPAVFLDRDGTLNVKPPEHEYVTSVDDFHWIPGAREAMGRLSEIGYVLTVVSNQRGVARGLVSRATLDAIEQRIQRDLAGEGCAVERFRYCFHNDEDGCDCRKPRPGMIVALAEELDLDLARSWVIGDAATDVVAGKAAGCRTALVDATDAETDADVLASSLAEASEAIAAGSQPVATESSGSNSATRL